MATPSFYVRHAKPAHVDLADFGLRGAYANSLLAKRPYVRNSKKRDILVVTEDYIDAAFADAGDRGFDQAKKAVENGEYDRHFDPPGNDVLLVGRWAGTTYRVLVVDVDALDWLT